MANDNGSFWVGYLGYPAIAYLMSIGKIPFDKEFAEALRDVAWKNINTKNKNDFAKTALEIDGVMQQQGVDIKKFHDFLDETIEAIEKLGLSLLGTKQKPPKGY